MKKLMCFILAAGSFTTPAFGQFFFAKFGGGFTTPVGNTGIRHDNGWNVLGGIGIMPVRYLGVVAEFNYNSLGVNGSTLGNLGFPGGSTQVWSATLNPTIRINPRGRVGLYLIGGGGFYQRRVQFTAPTTATFTGFDPFFGVVYPVVVPAEQVLAEYVDNKGGVNGGAGLTFGGEGRAKFFAEARYHYMYTQRPTTFLPVTFGVRW